jgi:uncharacterized protein with NRDE domain
MCLLLIAVRAVPGKPLLLLGNRDEFRARATAPAAPWTEDARVVGGRDLVAGGGWLALRTDGRHAAVTNVRSGLPATAPKSRGWLVRDFVLGDAEPRAYLEAAHADVESYGAFNLVVGDSDGTWVYGTADSAPRRLEDGVHVISNGRIGVHWPDTGVGIELERLLAPIFVRGSAHYGTRAGTLAYLCEGGVASLLERGFGPEMRIEHEVVWRHEPSAPNWKTATTARTRSKASAKE